MGAARSVLKNRMMIRLAAAVSALALLGACETGPSPEEILQMDWSQAARLDTPPAYSEYMRLHPDSPNVVSAQRRIDELMAMALLRSPRSSPPAPAPVFTAKPTNCRRSCTDGPSGNGPCTGSRRPASITSSWSPARSTAPAPRWRPAPAPSGTARPSRHTSARRPRSPACPRASGSTGQDAARRNGPRQAWD